MSLPSRRAAFGDGVHDDAIARLTAAMTLTAGGTALMYYGEEIGMADLTAAELKDVPLGPTRVLLTSQPDATADLANPVLAPFATRLVAFRVR
ncbi:UNVERIFIED_ORG: glycosidase [Sphingomonas sp. R1F5B]|uniref:hypothetical protein n=1 Tax=unclassified Novosphingobium TaxID=2644732 RepID=UPI0003B6B216|nr:MULTISPECIES: hypothetical protein [unclassified Novosphingobium]KPF55743.1 hypothetical protein IP65_06850 [Novosphingobium sp. AAP1]